MALNYIFKCMYTFLKCYITSCTSKKIYRIVYCLNTYYFFFKYKYIFCFGLFLTGKRSSSEWRRSRSGKTFKKSALVRCSFRCNGANFNCSWNCISYGFLFIIQIRKKTLIGNHHSLNNILCTRWIGKARNYYEQKHIVKKLQSLCCTDALKGAFWFTFKKA